MARKKTDQTRKYKREYMRKWRKTHKVEFMGGVSIKEYYKKYREEHKDKIKEYNKKWVKTRGFVKYEYAKEYRKTENGRVIKHRHKAKRRLLGFIPLNLPFKDSEAHHIDIERVIYIPKSLHKSITHNVWTGQNMEVINNLAVEYLKTAGKHIVAVEK